MEGEFGDVLAPSQELTPLQTCRGDICDFQPIMRKLKKLSSELFVNDISRRLLPGSMEFHLSVSYKNGFGVRPDLYDAAWKICFTQTFW